MLLWTKALVHIYCIFQILNMLSERAFYEKNLLKTSFWRIDLLVPRLYHGTQCIVPYQWFHLLWYECSTGILMAADINPVLKYLIASEPGNSLCLKIVLAWLMYFVIVVFHKQINKLSWMNAPKQNPVLLFMRVCTCWEHWCFWG